MGRDVDVIDKNIAMTFTPSCEHLLLVLRQNKLDWFSFVTEVEMTFTSGRLPARSYKFISKPCVRRSNSVKFTKVSLSPQGVVGKPKPQCGGSGVSTETPTLAKEQAAQDRLSLGVSGDEIHPTNSAPQKTRSH